MEEWQAALDDEWTEEGMDIVLSAEGAVQFNQNQNVQHARNSRMIALIWNIPEEGEQG